MATQCDLKLFERTTAVPRFCRCVVRRGLRDSFGNGRPCLMTELVKTSKKKENYFSSALPRETL